MRWVVVCTQYCRCDTDRCMGYDRHRAVAGCEARTGAGGVVSRNSQLPCQSQSGSDYRDADNRGNTTQTQM